MISLNEIMDTVKGGSGDEGDQLQDKIFEIKT